MARTSMIIAAALAMGVAGAAQAQEAASDDDMPFTGLYIGASGGYDVQGNDIGSIVQFDRNGDNVFAENVTTAAGANAFSPGFCNGRAFNAIAAQGCENDRNKASYYGRVGYDRQFGSLVGGSVVGGAVVEFGKSEIRDYVSAFSTTPASYTFERRLNWEASARLRAGVAFGDGLFYLTGGAGYADIQRRFATTNTANVFTPNDRSNKQLGFIVGGGVEKFLTRNISFGLEYSYHDYIDRGYLVRVTQGTAPATNPFVLAPNTAGTTFRRSDPNFRWHSIRGAINFHF